MEEEAFNASSRENNNTKDEDEAFEDDQLTSDDDYSGDDDQEEDQERFRSILKNEGNQRQRVRRDVRKWQKMNAMRGRGDLGKALSLIHISEPTRPY